MARRALASAAAAITLMAAVAVTVTVAAAPPASAATVDLHVTCGNWIDADQSFPVVDVAVERGDTLDVTFNDNCLDADEGQTDARTHTGITDYFSSYPGQGGSTFGGQYIGHYTSGQTATWVIAEDAPWGEMPRLDSMDESYPILCTNCGIGVALRLTVGHAPSAPAAPSATAAATSATVTWSTPSDPGTPPVDAYLVTATPGGATCSATPPTTSCVVEGLTPGTSYTFSVVASNVVGDSPASAASEAITIPTSTTTSTTTPSGSPTTTVPGADPTPAAATAVATTPTFAG